MSLFQQIVSRPDVVSRPIGPIVTALCQGRGCGNRTAPVFVALGVRGALLLCAECRAWKDRIIRQRLSEIRRGRAW